MALEPFDAEPGAIDRVFQGTPAVVSRPDRQVYGVVDDTTTLSDLICRLATELGLSESK